MTGLLRFSPGTPSVAQAQNIICAGMVILRQFYQRPNWNLTDSLFIAAAVKKYEDERTILGYQAIVDWDRVHKETVTALIEVTGGLDVLYLLVEDALIIHTKMYSLSSGRGLVFYLGLFFSTTACIM